MTGLRGVVRGSERHGPPWSAALRAGLPEQARLSVITASVPLFVEFVVLELPLHPSAWQLFIHML